MNLSISEISLGNIFFILNALIFIFFILKPEVGMKKMIKSKNMYISTFGTSNQLTKKFVSLFYYLTGTNEDNTITDNGIKKFRRLMLFSLGIIYIATRF